MRPFQPTVGARLLEVHAHHDDQPIGELVLERRQARRVIDGRVVVVDRAGADDHEQTIVRAVQYAMDGVARLVDCG
jgi:hypothetical protein